MRRRVFVRPERLAICRFPSSQPPPAWVIHSEAAFFSITRTPDELSVVCAEDDLPPSVTGAEAGWRAFSLEGPIPFNEVGVLAGIVAPLSAAGIPVFALSTYDTDYVLVREADLARAIERLRGAFEVTASA